MKYVYGISWGLLAFCSSYLEMGDFVFWITAYFAGVAYYSVFYDK